MGGGGFVINHFKDVFVGIKRRKENEIQFTHSKLTAGQILKQIFETEF